MLATPCFNEEPMTKKSLKKSKKLPRVKALKSLGAGATTLPTGTGGIGSTGSA